MSVFNTKHLHRSYTEPGLRSRWQQWLVHPWFLPAVFVSGLGLRLATVVVFPLTPVSDSAWYLARAQELSTGLGYQKDGFPTAYWPVGWPAILAGGLLLTGNPAVAIPALNLLAASATMALILWFGRWVLNDEYVGRLGLLIYALYPNHIAYTGAAATEVVYTAIVLAAFYALIRWRHSALFAIVSGVLFGVATLVKPQTYLFPIGAIVALLLVYRNYSWRSTLGIGLLLYCALFAIVLPWSFRNSQVFGEFVLVSTNGGAALLIGANDNLTGDHIALEETPAYRDLGIPWGERVARQIELDKAQRSAAIQWIKNNTARYVMWMPRKVIMLWRKDTDGFWAFDETYPQAYRTVLGIQIANQAYYVLILLFAVPCAVVALRALIQRNDDRLPLALLFCMPMFVSLLAAVFSGQVRYHFPAMPFLVLAAAWTLRSVAQQRASMNFSRGNAALP